MAPRPTLDLRTERLLLRPWVAADTLWHRHLVSERAGAGANARGDEEIIRGVLSAQEKHGTVPSVVVRRADGVVLGYTGLVIGRSSAAEPELAYELFRAYHGRGYATEAAQAVVAAARVAGYERLWSTIRPDNLASRRVIMNVGFDEIREDCDDRARFLWYSLPLGVDKT